MKNWVLFVGISILGFSPTARAWGPQGHNIVAMIAQSRLSPKAIAMVKSLLGDGVGLEQVANCPDKIRDSTTRTKCANFWVDPDPSTEGWHVLNIPLSASPTEKTLGDYCQGCVVDQIRKDFETLKAHGGSKDQKRLALTYLVHFVGDIHQPLHCAIDNPSAPSKARYGNTKKVMFEGTSINLHHFWDHLLRTDDEAKKLNQAEIAHRLEGGLKDREKEWLSGDFVAASALESFRVAQSKIYPNYDVLHGTVDKAYQDQWMPLITERLQAGGVRLAELLNRAAEGSGH